MSAVPPNAAFVPRQRLHELRQTLIPKACAGLFKTQFVTQLLGFLSMQVHAAAYNKNEYSFCFNH